jgi:hypothetical protein
VRAKRFPARNGRTTLGDITVGYVKSEIKNDATGESEWMWLKVDRCDEPNRFVFGWLDSEPVVFSSDLKLGQHMAVSYDNVRDHKKPSDC